MPSKKIKAKSRDYFMWTTNAGQTLDVHIGIYIQAGERKVESDHYKYFQKYNYTEYTISYTQYYKSAKYNSFYQMSLWMLYYHSAEPVG